jgi:hypothetical protein
MRVRRCKSGLCGAIRRGVVWCGRHLVVSSDVSTASMPRGISDGDAVLCISSWRCVHCVWKQGTLLEMCKQHFADPPR